MAPADRQPFQPSAQMARQQYRTMLGRLYTTRRNTHITHAPHLVGPGELPLPRRLPFHGSSQRQLQARVGSVAQQRDVNAPPHNNRSTFPPATSSSPAVCGHERASSEGTARRHGRQDHSTSHTPSVLLNLPDGQRAVAAAGLGRVALARHGAGARAVLAVVLRRPAPAPGRRCCAESEQAGDKHQTIRRGKRRIRVQTSCLSIETAIYTGNGQV